MRVAVILGLLSWLSLPASAQTWQSIGPAGGDVRSLAQDAQNPEQLYLGTTDGHIFGSADSGSHWRLLGHISERFDSVVTAILVDPRDSRRLYAASWTLNPSAGGGLFQSNDGGHTWSPSGLAGQAVRALAQAPSDPNRLFAGTLEGVFGSRDAGHTWERISPESNKELRNLDSLAVDPRQPDVFYAGTFHLPWKTSDGGRTWTQVHEGMIDDSDVMSLLIDRVNSDLIYASACSGIYRSENGATLWQKIQGIPYAARRTQVITQDPVHPGIIYAGTTEGLWKSGDAGATWNLVTPAVWVINAMVLPPNHPGRVVLGTDKLGVVVSDDNGEHFHEANDGFSHRQVAAVTFDENRGHILTVLANAPEPILVSENGGKSWAALGAGLTTQQLKRVFASPDGWLASLQDGGLMQYDAQHASWNHAGIFLAGKINLATPPRVAQRRQGASVALREKSAKDPVVNDLIFTPMRWYAATEHGLFVSEDRGARWQLMPLGPLQNLPVDSVRIGDADSLWVVGQGGLAFSSDGGYTWTWHNLPPDSGGALRLELIQGSLEDKGTLIALARTGLFVSRDGGTSWQRAGVGLPQVPVEAVTVVGNLCVVSLHMGGLFFSKDSCRTWTRVTGDLAYGFFSGLTVGADQAAILVASSTDGLYKAIF